MQPEQMSAAQIHNLWMKQPNHSYFSDKYPARKYYILVRDAMYRELNTTGRCDLMEESLNAPVLNVVLYHSICDVLQATSRNSSLSKVDREYLVGYGLNWAWFDLCKRRAIPFIKLDPEQWRTLLQNYNNITAEFQKKCRLPPQTGTTPGKKPNPTMPNPEETAARCTAMLADAQKKSNQILSTAQGNAARILEQAKAEAAQIRLEAQMQAREQAQSLVNQQLAQYMQQQRNQWEADRQSLEQARADRGEAIPGLKETVCGITTVAGAQMNRSLEEAIEQLTALKSGLLIDLNQWRAELYRCEYSPLIQFYTNFLTVSAQFEQDLCTEVTQPMTPEQKLTVLQRHCARMNTLRNNLLRAMEAMGLRTFTPQPGEVFDSYLHAANDAQDDDLYNGQIIERCISPGIERVVNSQVTDVLQRATVQLRTEAEKREDDNETNTMYSL